MGSATHLHAALLLGGEMLVRVVMDSPGFAGDTCGEVRGVKPLNGSNAVFSSQECTEKRFSPQPQRGHRTEPGDGDPTPSSSDEMPPLPEGGG